MSERAIRVGEQLRSDLMNLLLRGRLRDPAAKDVLITAVRVSADLQHARVYVRTLQESTARKQQRVVAGLERAAGFLRRELGQNLKLR
ncbi:MAG: 30S ribosome-binding factor RbfA, partial [Myxococcota bacterium]